MNEIIDFVRWMTELFPEIDYFADTLVNVGPSYYAHRLTFRLSGVKFDFFQTVVVPRLRRMSRVSWKIDNNDSAEVVFQGKYPAPAQEFGILNDIIRGAS